MSVRQSTTLTRMTRIAAGRSRLARFAQKVPSRIRPVDWISRNSCPVIRKPLMTKNTSTPTYPPVTLPGQTWKTTTSRTAIARSPWMCGSK